MGSNENIEKLQDLYDGFYKELKLNENYCKGNRKFQNNIRIGSNYFGGTPKILIVGLDSGSDNKKPLGKIKFEKEITISIGGKVNPHMAGTYGTVLYFQTDEKWKEYQEDLLKSDSFQSFIHNPKMCSNELLSSFAIVNFYSFVTKGRKNKTGKKDRVFLDEKVEKEHLVKVINEIDPDIIVVQSKSLKGYFKSIRQSIENKEIQIYIGFHPSVFGKYIQYRTPKIYFDKLWCLK